MQLTKEQIDAALEDCDFLELTTDVGLQLSPERMKVGSFFKNVEEFQAVYREMSLGRARGGIDAELDAAFGVEQGANKIKLSEDPRASITLRGVYRLIMKDVLLPRKNTKGFVEPMALDSYKPAPAPIKLDFVTKEEAERPQNNQAEPQGFNPDSLAERTLDALNAQVSIANPQYFAEEGAFETKAEAVAFLSKNHKVASE